MNREASNMENRDNNRGVTQCENDVRSCKMPNTKLNMCTWNMN